MLNSYYLQKLTQEIKNLDSLKQYALLKGEWKNAGFNFLSQLLQTKLEEVLTQDEQYAMGTTITGRTLRDTFRGKKNYDKYLHPHALNTLNKLAIFADYKSWDHFIAESNKLGPDDSTNKSSEDSINKPPEELIEIVIHSALAAELELYLKLPTINIDQLAPQFITEEIAFKNIYQDASVAKEQNWTLAYPTYNPSSVKLVDHTITLTTDTSAKVSTKEKWILAWWHLQKEDFINRYDKTIRQTYTLEKINNIWKIKTRLNSNGRPSLKLLKATTNRFNLPLPIDSPAKKNLELLIRQAMDIELKGYLDLPSFNPAVLDTLFIKNSPAYKELTHNLLLAQKRNWSISDKNNPSANELINCSIIQMNDTSAKVNTKEYWLLWWWHSLEKKHVCIHKEVSHHTYLLEQVEKQWYIKTNASGSNSLRIPLE